MKDPIDHSVNIDYCLFSHFNSQTYFTVFSKTAIIFWSCFSFHLFSLCLVSRMLCTNKQTNNCWRAAGQDIEPTWCQIITNRSNFKPQKKLASLREERWQVHQPIYRRTPENVRECRKTNAVLQRIVRQQTGMRAPSSGCKLEERKQNVGCWAEPPAAGPVEPAEPGTAVVFDESWWQQIRVRVCCH